MRKLITSITGKELMERWDMDGHQVIRVMKKVIPSTGDWELKNLLSNGYLNTQVEFARLIQADDIPKDIDIKIASFQFALSIIEEIEKKFNLLPEKQDEALIKNRLRPSQKAKIECREVAKKLIIKHPEMGINEMADHPEIKEHGGDWTRNTRYRWICDLFPAERRQPGRRTKSKKNQI